MMLLSSVKKSVLLEKRLTTTWLILSNESEDVVPGASLPSVDKDDVTGNSVVVGSLFNPSLDLVCVEEDPKN